MTLREMCDVCCEQFTCHNKNIKCQFCDFSSCRQCHKTYVFGTTNDFHCMSCKKEWSDDYIAYSFPKKMYNTELRDHRENLIVEKEKMFLPNAQECIERYMAYKRYIVHIKECKRKKNELWEKVIRKEQISWYEYNQLTTAIEVSTRRTHELKAWVTNDKVKEQQVRWIWPCPEEDCRGFLTEQHKCGVCQHQFCKDCHEHIEDGHVCDKDKKKTIQMIKKDSKPCPKCSTVIYKIDGCDQMWCPDCQTAFSWDKGTIETNIHNPHYYEYLRNTQGYVPRTDQDYCDFPIHPQLMVKCKDHPSIGVYINLFRNILHAYNYTRGMWGNDKIEEQIGEHQLKFLRVKYLCKDLTYDRWKWQLQKRYKAVRKCNEINQVFDTLHKVARDLFWDDTSDVDDINKQIIELLTYINSAFNKISKRFNCIAPFFEIDEELYIDCIVDKY